MNSLPGSGADIQEAADDLRQDHRRYGTRPSGIKFKASFDQIVINFEQEVQELFGGGHAELRLSTEEDPAQLQVWISGSTAAG